MRRMLLLLATAAAGDAPRPAEALAAFGDRRQGARGYAAKRP